MARHYTYPQRLQRHRLFMSLVFDGVTIDTVYFDGVEIETLIFDGVEVFSALSVLLPSSKSGFAFGAGSTLTATITWNQSGDGAIDSSSSSDSPILSNISKLSDFEVSISSPSGTYSKSGIANGVYQSADVYWYVRVSRSTNGVTTSNFTVSLRKKNTTNPVWTCACSLDVEKINPN